MRVSHEPLRRFRQARRRLSPRSSTGSPWVAARVGLARGALRSVEPRGDRCSSRPTTGHERQQLGVNDYLGRGDAGRSPSRSPRGSLLAQQDDRRREPSRYRGRATSDLAGRANLGGFSRCSAAPGSGGCGETYLVGSNHRLLTELQPRVTRIPNAYVHTRGADAAVDVNWGGSAAYPGLCGGRR